jgi:hypothetical protein
MLGSKCGSASVVYLQCWRVRWREITQSYQVASTIHFVFCLIIINSLFSVDTYLQATGRTHTRPPSSTLIDAAPHHCSTRSLSQNVKTQQRAKQTSRLFTLRCASKRSQECRQPNRPFFSSDGSGQTWEIRPSGRRGDLVDWILGWCGVRAGDGTWLDSVSPVD